MGQIISALTLQDLLVTSLLAAASFVVIRSLRPGTRSTVLPGPPRGSFLFGQSNVLREAGPEAAARIHDGWAAEYGTVFNRPGPFGSKITMLTDPKAIAHFYAAGETTFEATTIAKRLLPSLTGDGILTAHGDDHKRQRRAMSAGFSNVKMREYTSIFFESAYKVKTAWDQQLENNDSFQLNITPWINAISLDSMGLAGFSHDFGALNGQTSPLGAVFTKMANTPFTVMDIITFLLQPVLPFLSDMPTKRTAMRKSFHSAGGKLARQLLSNAIQTDDRDNKSIIALLIKSQQASTGFPMSEEEVNAQMRTLMLAGFETTSVSMTWGLIELARNPDVQDALRKELREAFSSSDPTWDELMTGLPMLDAVVHETLRLHSVVPETIRQAGTDDVIPLGAPITLPNGQMTDHVVVAAGQLVGVPISAVNRMRSLWGEDAWEFKPQRWLNNGEGIPAAAREVQGHRNLITFVNGPRTCLGKNFALAEFKAAFSVLIRNYSFELIDGPKAVIKHEIALVPRPTVEGQPRCHVPMRISRVE